MGRQLVAQNDPMTEAAVPTHASTENKEAPRGSEGTAESIATLLGDEIYQGKHAPDAPLREIALATRLGVSRRSVREALLLLERRGLVLHEHNRGARVRRMRQADVLDLYRVRRILEVQGARAAPTASVAARNHLASAYETLAASGESNDSFEIIRADLAFHGAVVGLADSPRIDEFFRHIGDEMRFAIALLREDETRSGVADIDVVADHSAIYRHLLDGDVVEATLAILQHIEFNERRLLRLVAA